MRSRWKFQLKKVDSLPFEGVIDVIRRLRSEPDCECNGDVATVVLDEAITSETRAISVRLPTGAFTLQSRRAVDEPILKSHPAW